MSNAFDRARELFRQGRALEGETVLAERVESTHESSAEHGEALFDLATYQAMTGSDRTALATLARAVEVTAELPDKRQHLTYLLNHGEFLQRAGRLADAEAAFRRGVPGREQYYGREHAGYGFGLQPLAAVLLAEGKVDDALPIALEAQANLRANQHPKAAGTTVLVAVIQLNRGQTVELAADLERPSAEEWAEIHDACSSAASLDPQHWVRVMPQLIDVAVETSADARVLEELLWMQENMSAVAGNAALRVAAYRRIHEFYEAQGNTDAAVDAQLGWAYSESEADDNAAAEARYRRVVEGATGSPAIRARAHTELGVFLSQRDREDEAAPILERAVEIARTVPTEPEDRFYAAGRALAAWGVFQQHRGDQDGVAELLESAVANLPATHPDALAASSHLRSLRAGEQCDCQGQIPRVIASLLLERLRMTVDADAVGDVIRSDDGEWQVEWTRDASEPEQELADRVLRQTLGEVTAQASHLYR